MITSQAKKLAALVKEAALNNDMLGAKQYSDKLVVELVENCSPTIDEFDKVTEQLLLSGRLLWLLVPAILEWQQPKPATGAYQVKEGGS